MINFSNLQVFVFEEEVDMRKGAESLLNLVRENLRKNIMEGNIFLFLGKNPRRLKVILFDGTGLVLILKRLEKGRFSRLSELDGRMEISHEELKLIFAATRINFSF